MKRTLALFAMTAAFALASDKTFTGVITDTMCGKDHTHMKVQPDAKCVRDCVKSGSYKYALLTADGRMLTLSDQATPEKFAAQKVRVTGTLYEKTGILKVTRIAAAQ
jgi:hypothetical protein